MAPASRERYRLLAATLHNSQTANGVRVIMIASAVAGEGKTLTAANLALTFSESYQRNVLLVDADLRRPTLHALFGDASADAVEEFGDPKLQIRRVTPLLATLTPRLPSSAPMAELTSGQMKGLLQSAREAFDWIIIDTPPVTLLPDASLLASMVDGSVFVVRAESTPIELVQGAIEAIGKKNILGVVLNAAKDVRRHHSQYDLYYRQVAASDASGSH
jgi:receptor protein-tyrosine kinase